MTTPNDDHIGRFIQRQPISSSIKVEAGDYVSPMGRQNHSIVKQVQPLPSEAIPACRPQKIGKNNQIIDGVSDEDCSEYVDEFGSAIGGYEKHLAELYLDGNDEAINLL